MSPFGWDRVALEVRGIDEGSAAQTLKEWFWHWFDAEYNDEPTSEGLFGVVHYLSDPEVTSTGLRVNIDLGSSPSSAFEDLLFRLADANASEVQVG